MGAVNVRIIFTRKGDGSVSLKIGIIGCGLITQHKYIPGFKKAGASIVGVCDLNHDLAKSIAIKNNIAKYYNDLEVMLKENNFDIISIATPPATHAKIAQTALQSGAHILIEKPMAMTVDECDKIINEAKKLNKKICVGHSDLFYPPVIKARKLLSEANIGEFRGMRVLLSTPFTYALSKSDHWIHKLPGGILGETGPHAVYLTSAFVKNIKEVEITTKKNFSYNWIKYDDVRMELKGENGISSVVITHSTDNWSAKIDIFGQKKTLSIDMHEFFLYEYAKNNLNTFSAGLSAVNRGLRSMCNIGKYVSLKAAHSLSYGHELLIKEFVKSVRDDQPSPVSPESGRETVRVMNMVIDKLGK